MEISFEVEVFMQKSNKTKINGILLLDKPVGPSSNAVMQEVKRLFAAEKVGHTGNLDPFASGMLPLCFGEATKWTQYLLDADKCYQATGRLGIKTTTADCTGEVIARCDDFSRTEEDLLAVLQQFIGTTKQIPSMYSALKHQGQPLYRLARKGQTVERQPRPIHIAHIHLLAFDGRDFRIEVLCSKGTYIRNLVEDIGEQLGVYAHVVALRRIYTAGLDNEPMVSLDQLKNTRADDLLSHLLPMDRPIAHLPKYVVTDVAMHALQQGKTISLDGCQQQGLVRLYEQGLYFKGLAFIDENNLLKAKRLVAVDA